MFVKGLHIYLLSFFLWFVFYLMEVYWTHSIGILRDSLFITEIASFVLFAAGVSLGGFVTGSYVDNAERPLRQFSILLLLFFFLSLIATPVIYLIRQFFSFFYEFVGDDYFGVNTLVFIFTFIALIIPAFVAGTAFSLLVRAYIRLEGFIGFKGGNLFAVGLLGGSCAVIFAQSFLIGNVGYSGMYYFALMVLLIIALAAYYLSEYIKYLPVNLEEIHNVSDSNKKILLVCMLLTIVGSISYQSAIVRILGVTVESNIASHGFIAGAIFVSIAAGVYCASFIKEIFQDRFYVLFMLGLLFALSLLVQSYLLEFLINTFYEYAISFWLLEFLFYFLVLFLPSMCLGGTALMVSRVYLKDIRHVGTEVGFLEVLVLVGMLGGIFFVPFIVFRYFSLTAALVFSSMLVLTSAIIFLYNSNVKRQISHVAVGVIIAVMPLMVLIVFGRGDYFVTVFESVAFKAESVEFLKSRAKVIYAEDGPLSSVHVTRRLNGTMSLYVDGHMEASADNVMLHELLTDVSLLLHEDPQDILILGAGSGAVLEAVTSHNVNSIDVVEPSHAVIDGLKVFREVNNEAFLDWRLKIFPTSPKNHIDFTDRTYDVILSNQTSPSIREMSDYFTNDFYKSVRRVLNPKGIFVQSLNIQKLTPQDFKSLIATFSNSFPYSNLWEVDGVMGDFLMIGSFDKFTLDFAKFGERFKVEQVLHGLEHTSIDSALAILSYFTLDDASMRKYSWGGTINSQDKNIVSFSTISNKKHLGWSDYSFSGLRSFDETLIKNMSDSERKVLAGDFKLRGLILQSQELIRESSIDKAVSILSDIDVSNISSVDVKRSIGNAYLHVAAFYLKTDVESYGSFLLKSNDIYEDNYFVNYLLGLKYMKQGNLDDAKIYFKHAVKIRPMSPEAHMGLSKIYEASKERELAYGEFTKVNELIKRISF